MTMLFLCVLGALLRLGSGRRLWLKKSASISVHQRFCSSTMIWTFWMALWPDLGKGCGMSWVGEKGTRINIFYFSFVLTIFIRQQTSDDSSKRHWTLNDLPWIVTGIELSIGVEYALLLRPLISLNLMSTSLIDGGWIIWNPSVSGVSFSLRLRTFVHESVSDICNNSKFT